MIRFGRKEDARQSIDLVLLVLKDMDLSIFKTLQLDKVRSILEEAFLNPAYRFGYKRCLVYEVDGNIAGVAFGYPSIEERTIDEPFQEIIRKNNYDENLRLFTDPETMEGEWYLDTISASPDYRGMGIGTQLLEALPDLAKKDGCKKIGLNVDKANPRARKLYAKLGFKPIKELEISGHTYEHMQKMI